MTSACANSRPVEPIVTTAGIGGVRTASAGASLVLTIVLLTVTTLVVRPFREPATIPLMPRAETAAV